jgi:hypothetical protein
MNRITAQSPFSAMIHGFGLMNPGSSLKRGGSVGGQPSAIQFPAGG